MSTDNVRRVHESIEVPNWAPWLRFSLADLREYDRAFPAGQIVHLTDDRPMGALTSVLRRWSGDPADLGTWDEVSGHDSSIEAAHHPDGDTLVMLSVSVHPEGQGRGVPQELVHHAREVAERLGLAHIISPFRPSGFGRHKAAGGDVDFAAYIASERDDGLPVDPWLRVLTRMGMAPLTICRRAMVVTTTLEDLDHHRATHHPRRWFRLDEIRAEAAIAAAPAEVVGSVDAVWECGETGSWFVDATAGRATYVEDNVWGELPLAAVPDGGRPRPRVTVRPGDPLAVRLLEEITARAGDGEVALGWVVSSDPRAEVVRALERDAFPDIEAFLDEEVESWCRFLVVVDLGQDPPEIRQAFRVSSHRFGDRDRPGIGMPTVDEILTTNDTITLEEIVEHYQGRGIDLQRTIAVETSFRIEGTRRGVDGLRWSDYGYIELFGECMRDRVGDEKRGVFAHVNEGTVRSLLGIGITTTPFAGRADLRSPASQPGTHDDRFHPAYIPAEGDNLTTFIDLQAIGAQAFLLDPEQAEVVIDITDATLAAEGRVASEEARQQPVQE